MWGIPPCQPKALTVSLHPHYLGLVGGAAPCSINSPLRPGRKQTSGQREAQPALGQLLWGARSPPALPALSPGWGSPFFLCYHTSLEPPRCAAWAASPPRALPWRPAHGGPGGISCSNQNRKAAYTGAYLSHAQLHSLAPRYPQLGINKNLLLCFQKTLTVPSGASTPRTV